MIRFSHFENCFDRSPLMVSMTWVEFVDYLKMAATVPSPSDKVTKEKTALISPAQYPPGATRSKGAVTGWNWVGLDVDGKTKDGSPRPGAPRFDDAVEVLEAMGLAYVVYSTTSSTAAMQCFRIVCPLSRTITADEHGAVWSALDQMLPGWLDPQTKDVSRILIEPRGWHNADNRISSRIEGKPLDPDWLVGLYPVPKPERPAIIVTPEMEAAFRARASWRAVKDLTWDDLTDLDKSRVVPPAALQRALSAGQGGRMISFLSSVALSALGRGFDITVADLVTIGKSLDGRIGVGHRDDIKRDAASALKWATEHHQNEALNRRAKGLALAKKLRI